MQACPARLGALILVLFTFFASFYPNIGQIAPNIVTLAQTITVLVALGSIQETV
jgi:uncharacterized membrane protein YqhA